MENTILAKYNKLTNKILIWQIIENTVSYGQYNGVMHVDKRLYEDELKRKMRLKLKHGYMVVTLPITHETKAKLIYHSGTDNETGNLTPMKAQKFQLNKFKYPAYAQPKINGVRAFIIWGTVVTGKGMFTESKKQAMILSKDGHRYVLPKIEQLFTENMFTDVDAYDGELYIPGFKLNEVRRCIPMINARGTLSQPSGNPDLVQFWNFDIGVENLSQRDRLVSLVHISSDNRYNFNITTNTMFDSKSYRWIYVNSKIVNNDDEVIAYTNMAINAGFEGAVIRDMEAEYAFGSRPKTMMKVKRFQDAEFEIIDIVSKVNEPDSALFVCRNDINDATFKVNPMGTLTERKEYLTNKVDYIGKKATVKFYERSGVKDVPFHASLITVRNYE